MTRALLAITTASLIFAPSATASVNVDFDASFYGDGDISIDTRWSGNNCSTCSTWPELVVRHDGEVVRRASWYAGYGSSFKSVDIALRCKRTGRHNWVVRQKDRRGRVLEERRGYFIVGRCYKRRDRKVNRTRASYADARAQSDHVYVSSVRCRPTRVARGPAARWTCIVTWNDNIRQCTDRDRLWFWSHERFGDRIEDFSIRSKRLGCRYF